MLLVRGESVGWWGLGGELHVVDGIRRLATSSGVGVYPLEPIVAGHSSNKVEV